jgi:hypothetical protein
MSPGLLLLVMDVRGGGLGRAILKPPSPINVAAGRRKSKKKERKERACRREDVYVVDAFVAGRAAPRRGPAR